MTIRLLRIIDRMGPHLGEQFFPAISKLVKGPTTISTLVLANELGAVVEGSPWRDEVGTAVFCCRAVRKFLVELEDTEWC